MRTGSCIAFVDLIQGYSRTAAASRESGTAGIVQIVAANLQLIGAKGNVCAAGGEGNGLIATGGALYIDVIGTITQLTVFIGPNHGIGHIRSNGVAGNSDRSLACAGTVGQCIVGCHDHIGLTFYQRSNLVISGFVRDLFTIGSAATLTGVNSVGTGAIYNNRTGVIMTGCGNHSGLALAAICTVFNLIAVLSAGCINMFGYYPGMRSSKTTFDAVRCSYGTTGGVTDNGNVVAIDHNHGAVTILDIARIHVGEVNGAGAATLRSQLATNINKVNRSIRRVFTGVVMTPQINDVMALANFIQCIHPGSAAGIVATTSVNGHMTHDKNNLGCISRCCPSLKCLGCAGSIGRIGHMVLINCVNIVISTLINLTGTGIGIGVGAVRSDVGVMGSVGVEGLYAGIYRLDLRRDGCKRTTVCIVDIVTAKNDQAGRIGHSAQQRLQFG